MRVVKVGIAVVVMATATNSMAWFIVPGVYTWMEGELRVLAFCAALFAMAAVTIWALE